MTEAQPIAPPTQAATPFSWGWFLLGLFAALFAGCLAAFGAGLLAMAIRIQALGWIIGAVPGLILGAIGYWRRGRGGFGEGLLAGGCIITLIGGICGGAVGGGLDFK